MINENDSLFENEIWILINLLKEHIAFYNKWIYIFKRNVDDQVIRYKVHWIVRGFEQREELNYNETFVFIIKSMLYKTIFALIVIEDWNLK